MVNLSSLNISDSDVSLLDKGISFIPTPKLLPISTIIQNKNRLIRNIRIKYAFTHDNRPYDPKLKTFIDKSNWSPPDDLLHRRGTLHTTLNTVHNIELATATVLDNLKIDKHQKNFYLNNKNNLSEAEFTSLDKLKKNSDITIKPADKGGALVIMDTSNYLKEAYNQLDDLNYYRKMDNPIYLTNKTSITNILDQMQHEGFLTTKQVKYLSGPPTPRARLFYTLPKIHKDSSSWFLPGKQPKGRPIVSDIESESYRVSDYIEQFLKPLACKHPSYIKNSYEFIDKIKNLKVDTDTYLVTGDIESLYTNMKHNLTMTSVRDIFKKYPDNNRPDTFILDLLRIILENNDFNFNGDTYLQTCGMPMGKIIGPSCANIYLLEFDEKAMNDFKIKPVIFIRYLDDIFFLWQDTLDNLILYENFLNNITPGIKIKLEYSLISANFLDVTIFKRKINNTNSLATKVYIKPTDAQNLLHSDSFHPPHTTKGILKSQLIRYKRLSSSYQNYLNSCKLLFHNLKPRGYTWSNMRNEFRNVWLTDNKHTVHDNKTDIFPIIMNFDNIGTKLAYDYRAILRNTELFKHKNIIIAYKNHKNLRQKLL